MPRPKPTVPAKKVWRISDTSPQGEWVDKTAPVAAEPLKETLDSPREVTCSNWMISSYELLDGTEVNEDPETLPGDLFDELFAPGQRK
jgi:hypothetical protein